MIIPAPKHKDSMNIYILSNSRSLYSTRRFFEEAVKSGHDAKVYPPVGLSLSIEKNRCEVYYDGQRIPFPDVIIPRVGQRKTNYTMAVIKHFEINHAISLNKTQGILRARDKLRSLQVLAQKGIPVPRTVFIDQNQDIDDAIERIGGAPIIIKLTEGTQGMGVMLAESKRSARSILESVLNQGQHVLLQEFIQESKGNDIRAIVLGDRVIASMRRSSLGDEFRSNIHRGGKQSQMQLSIEAEQMAKLAVRSLGVQFAGVDLIESKRGPLILEVNPSPGLEGIETVTEKNIAGECIRFLEKTFMFTERKKYIKPA
ncbi:MAG: RimK family alpha-L-glutamate ligase [Leptospirales bacterium]